MTLSNAGPSRSPCNHSTQEHYFSSVTPDRPNNRNLVSNGRFPISSTSRNKQHKPAPWRSNRPTTLPFPRPLDQLPTPQHLTYSLKRTRWSDAPCRLPLSHVETNVSPKPTTKAMLRGRTDTRKSRTTTLQKKTTQSTPKRVCGGDEKTGKNNRPTTHTEERKRERLARKGKSHFAYEDTKKQKRASSRGDRDTPGRHAAVEEGSWPHRYPAHFPAKITRALHSPPSLVVVLWPTSFRYPYSIRLRASPVNASDR